MIFLAPTDKTHGIVAYTKPKSFCASIYQSERKYFVNKEENDKQKLFSFVFEPTRTGSN